MNSSELVREKQLNVRLSPPEAERLERVSAHYGLSGPNVLRMLLKREDERLAQEAAAVAPTKPAPKPRRK